MSRVPKVIIIENPEFPICEQTKQQIYNRYSDFEYEIITDDREAYKRTLTNRFNIAFIDVNFIGQKFDAFDMIRACILSGKPVVIVKNGDNCNCGSHTCKKCEQLTKINTCSNIQACHVSTWNDLLQPIEEATIECPVDQHVNLNHIFEQLKKCSTCEYRKQCCNK